MIHPKRAEIDSDYGKIEAYLEEGFDGDAITLEQGDVMIDMTAEEASELAHDLLKLIGEEDAD